MELKVGIIIPVYNVERYLRQCLDSVVNQTYSNLNILIIDDGSTDKSGLICDEYSMTDERIVVYHTDNKGLSAARNFGLDHCTDDYIAFLDSDDWMEEQAIEKLLSAIVSENADVAVCAHYIEWKDHQDIESIPDLSRVVQGDEIIRDYLHGRGIGVQVWNKLYRSELFGQIGFPEGRIHEDVATTYRLLEASNKLVRVPYPLLHYRMRKRSLGKSHTLSSLTDMWLSCYERYVALIEKFEDCSVELTSACIRAIGRFWVWYYGCAGDNESAAQTILKMQAFVKEHRNEVLKNNQYSKFIRFSCSITHFSNPLMFGLLYYFIRMYQGCWRTNTNRMYE